MALFQMNYFSNTLKMNTCINIIIPTPNSDEYMNHKDISYFSDDVRYQVLYLLHGTYGDCTEWCRYTSIEKYAQQYKIAVIMPSCENSYYYDMYSGPQYFTFLTEELPKVLTRLFPLSNKREDNFIAGLSMGGYGAWNIAVSKPEKFAAAANLSGDIDLTSNLKSVQQNDGPWPFNAVFQNCNIESIRNSEENLIVKLQKKIKQNIELPRLFHTVGTEDFIYKRVQISKSKLDDLGANILFEDNPGIHDWYYWDTHIQRVLEWFELKGKTVPKQVAE